MTRQFMTQIRLPADPTQPLEAATKQYVDALSGNEVMIDPNQPADPLVELWVDTDDIANPGDEVFVGPDDPITQAPNIELWYDTDDPTGNAGSIPAGGSAGQVLGKVSNADYDDAWVNGIPLGGAAGQVLAKKTVADRDTQWVTPVQMVAASYTPTLTNQAVGVGGTNQADYIYIGGPNTGDVGQMTVQGRIVFGTSGQTFPNDPRVSLPAGFQLSPAYTTWELGQCRHNISGVGYSGVCAPDVSIPTVLRFFYAYQVGTTAGAGIGQNPVTPTAPTTWVAGAEIRWKATLMVVRI